MILRRFKHMLLRMSAEEKVIGIGCLAVLLGVFMPWFSVVPVVDNFDKGTTASGFAGDLGVIGFVVFLLMLMTLGFLMADHLRFRMPRFGFGKESLMLFFSGESAFLMLLAIAIFTKKSLDYTNAEIRFGVYMALIGTILATFAAFAQTQKLQKKEAKAFFEHEEEKIEEEKVEEAEEPAEEPVPEKHHEKRHHHKKEEKVEEKEVEQERFFEEEFQEPVQVVSEPEPSEPLAEVEAPVAEVDEEQKKYFLQETDLPVPQEPEKEVVTEEEAPAPTRRDMGFYNDL